ncbi:hypothetical protein SNE40_002636 [Patella caerulea]|uniref:Uncharacterized protein n=1 Tax=Patella caerulea TaxID=87958 RepID=A0AAN8K6A8_PATCE
MAEIIISFRSVNQMYDCLIYTKELSNVTFDCSVKVIFNFEHFEMDGKSSCDSCQIATKRVKNSLITNHVHCENNADNDLDVTHNAKVAKGLLSVISNNQNRTFEDDTAVFLCVNPNKKCVLLMDAHLACCVAQYVKKNRIFRHRFLKYVKRNFGYLCETNSTHWNTKLLECGYLNVPYSIDIVSVWPKQKINIMWCQRIQHLVAKRCQLEESMAWLSTLGGGYSSLGDYFSHCAEKAGQISIRQLKLAMEMSDPVMASKCRVFWAQSLLQQGYLHLCKRIVWKEYQYAKTNGTRDTRLENMCISVWNRLKYLLKLNKSKKKQKKGL